MRVRVVVLQYSCQLSGSFPSDDCGQWLSFSRTGAAGLVMPYISPAVSYVCTLFKETHSSDPTLNVSIRKQMLLPRLRTDGFLYEPRSCASIKVFVIFSFLHLIFITVRRKLGYIFPLLIYFADKYYNTSYFLNNKNRLWHKFRNTIVEDDKRWTVIFSPLSRRCSQTMLLRCDLNECRKNLITLELRLVCNNKIMCCLLFAIRSMITKNKRLYF